MEVSFKLFEIENLKIILKNWKTGKLSNLHKKHLKTVMWMRILSKTIKKLFAFNLLLEITLLGPLENFQRENIQS